MKAGFGFLATTAGMGTAICGWADDGRLRRGLMQYGCPATGATNREATSGSKATGADKAAAGMQPITFVLIGCILPLVSRGKAG